MKIKLSVVSLMISLLLLVMLNLVIKSHAIDVPAKSSFYVPYIYVTFIMIILAGVLALASLVKREFGIYLLYTILSILILLSFSFAFFVFIVIGI